MNTITKYEKNLNSKDPFIRSMYEDLEKRIQHFETHRTDRTSHATLKDAGGPAIIMAVITVALILTIV